MEVSEAIRTRRTHKQFDPEPLDREQLERLLDAGRWAPNHHLTNPWRFSLLGPAALERLKRAADAEKPGSSRKLERGPTKVLVSSLRDDDDHVRDEDRLATAAAIYAVLLAAHADGLAGFWASPLVISTEAGRKALRLPDEEDAIALLHLGRASHQAPDRDRAPLDEILRYLD